MPPKKQDQPKKKKTTVEDKVCPDRVSVRCYDRQIGLIISSLMLV